MPIPVTDIPSQSLVSQLPKLTIPLTGNEFVPVNAAGRDAITTTQTIANLGGSGGGGQPAPFFGTALKTGWSRPGLSIGGSGNNFTSWLNQGAAPFEAVAIPLAGPFVVDPGVGNYAPGDTITLTGGTFSVATVLTLTDTQAVSATVVSGGHSGAPGAVTITGTTGTGTLFQATGTISAGGALTNPLTVLLGSDYTVNPTVPTVEPVTGGSLVSATVNVVLGALSVNITTPGTYTVPPVYDSPVGQSSSSGSGTGATWQVSYTGMAFATDNTNGLPLTLITNNASQTSGPDLTALLKPKGAAPWTITSGLAQISESNGHGAAPIVLYDSVHDIAITLSWYFDSGANNIQAILYKPTLVASTPAITTTPSILVPSSYFMWFRVVNDGTHLKFYFSFEDVEFVCFTILPVGFGGISIDHVGFGLDQQGITFPAMAALWNWVES